jgi:hypothetical protein
MASVAEIAPLSTEFNMPGQQTQAKDAVTKEIEKLGEVIIEKTSVGLKAATQAVIGDVPKMIADLTKEIESGPVDNFAIAIRKLIKLVDDLGINLRDYNDKLADTVSEFTGTQAKLEEKLAELREKGIKAEIDENGKKINILTQQEIKAYEKEKITNEKSIEVAQKEIQERLDNINLLEKQGNLTEKARDDLQSEIKYRSKNIEGLKEENEQIDKKLNTTDTGRDTGGFSKLAELKEAFMIIPDTITEVFEGFASAGKAVFGGLQKLFTEPMKTLKSAFAGITGIFTTARALIALKVMAVVMAFQFFAEKIEAIGAFFIGIWEKITGFFQGIVDWFKNSAVGKFFGFGGKDEPKEDTSNKSKDYGTAGSMGAETDYYVDNENAPVRNMTSATLEDGLVNQTVDTTLSDYDDNSAKIIAQRQMASMDGEGTEEIDYTGMRGGTSLSQLGIKNRAVVGNQLKGDDTMYGGVSESLKELNAENAAVSSQPNIMIQNNSNVNSNSSSGTTVSGFVDHEPDTSFKYIRSGATGSDQF